MVEAPGASVLVCAGVSVQVSDCKSVYLSRFSLCDVSLSVLGSASASASASVPTPLFVMMITD